MSDSPSTVPPRRRLHLTLWVVQWALGISLVMAGAVKLALPGDAAAEFFPWSVDVPVLFTVTSVLDLLGGLGVILPSLTRILPRLSVVASIGVVLLMLSAVVFYLSRGEASEIAPNLVLAGLAAFVAWGRGRAVPISSQLPAAALMTDPLPVASPPSGVRVFQLPTGSYETRASFAVDGGSFGDLRHFASTAVLVQHPEGDLLIDAGFGAHATEHIAMLPSFRRSPHDVTATVAEQLDAAGYNRDRLLGVLLTHSHWDHVSGLDSLDVPVWITEAEQAYAAGSKGDPVFVEVSRNHEIRHFGFEGPEYLGFPSSHDFHGDGSVVIVPAAGHTDGSVIVFVTTAASERFAFIGDLTWQLDGITERRQRPLLMRMLADSDAKKVRSDLARILTLTGRVQIVPSHDARGYEGIPVLGASS
jgi:N-acyl homoserine lactone hydrolase